MLVHRRERIILLTFLIPALLLLVVFLGIPALWAVYLSFTDRALSGEQARHVTYICLDNYVSLFQDPNFWQSFWLMLVFVFLSAIVGQFVLGLLAALLLNRKGLRGEALYSAAILMPLVVPETMAAYAEPALLHRHAPLPDVRYRRGSDRRLAHRRERIRCDHL